MVFGSSSSGLTSAQLNQVRFVNPPGLPASSCPAAVLASGEVVPVDPTPVFTGAADLDNGWFQLSLTGAPGCKYAVFTSTNLSDWLGLLTNYSPFAFTDTNTSAWPHRLYRASYIP